MADVKILDKTFRPYMDAAELGKIVNTLSEKINGDYADKEPLFIVVLNGAFIFASDLFKTMKMPCRVSLLKVASYEGTQSIGKIKTLIGLNEEIKGLHVVIIEDIIDTGNTMFHLRNEILKQDPASLKICTLLFKPDKFEKDYPIDYIGKSIPNDFVVGYGFDYDGYGRNLPNIYQVNE